MQEHDVHVAERIELAAAVAADGDDGEALGRRALFAAAIALGGAIAVAVFAELEGARHAEALHEVADDQINEARPLRADFPAALAGVVLQPDAVIFDLEELFVSLDQILGLWSALGVKLLLQESERLFALRQGKQRGRRLGPGAAGAPSVGSGGNGGRVGRGQSGGSVNERQRIHAAQRAGSMHHG